MSNRLIKSVNKVSKLFQPVKIYPKEAVIKDDKSSKSYRLMLDMGIIQQSCPGMYTLLPLGYRALEKLTAIVDNEMSNIGAQKMLLPHMTETKLWKKTGRTLKAGPELFTLKDRHMDSYLLSPTYEEAITNLIAKYSPLTKRNLPLLLYQISTKWRDEMKPRLGLFRGREFVMKDLYSFDLTAEDAANTYNLVHKSYGNIFEHIGIPYSVAIGDTGLMGGSVSHEYHYLSDIGEDTLLYCPSCDTSMNASLRDETICKKCNGEMTKQTGIEVAHTFLLDDTYSRVFNAECASPDGHISLAMGCYGLGLTRLLAATVEILSTNEEIRWPECIAPFMVCVIPPKEHSKEFPAAHYADRIIEMLIQQNVDVIVDDRISQTIGRRLIDAKRTGYPYLIVIGKSAILSNPRFELFDLNNSLQSDMSLDQLTDFFHKLGTAKTEDKSENKDETCDKSNFKLKSIYVNISTVSGQ